MVAIDPLAPSSLGPFDRNTGFGEIGNEGIKLEITNSNMAPVRLAAKVLALSLIHILIPSALFGQEAVLRSLSTAPIPIGSVRGNAEIPVEVLNELAEAGESLDVSKTDAFAAAAEGKPFACWSLFEAGNAMYEAGCYSKSLDLFERAWRLALEAKALDWRQEKLIAQIGAQLGGLYARLGRLEELKEVLAQMSNRPIDGAETLAFENLRQAVHSMEHFPEHSFKCGPLALGNVYSAIKGRDDQPQQIAEAASPREGFSLKALESMGDEIGLPVTAVRISDGDIPVPSVVHWKAGHYAAITKKENGRYLVEDPTFLRNVWMSAHAVRVEASGFYVIPSDVPGGPWPEAADADKASVSGKGAPSQRETNNQGGSADGSGEDLPQACQGLPVPGFNDFYAALTIRDIPMLYAPPVGPAVKVELTYFDASNYDNVTNTHGHPGRKWMLGWTRHVEVSSLSESGGTFRLFRTNGKSEAYSSTVVGGVQTVNKIGSESLSRIAIGGGVTGPVDSFTRSLPDGSSETFGYVADGGDPQAYGAIAGTGSANSRFYIAESSDPQGNKLRFKYVAGTAKLKKVMDALGQETTIYYSDAADGLGADNPARRLISAIQDPFGRVVRFFYDAQERLTRLVDVEGNETTFAYAVPATPDFITSMTTPYGTSQFEKSSASGETWLTLTDPEGLQEKLVFGFSFNGTPLPGVTGTSANPAEVPTTPEITIANGQAYFGYLYYGSTLHWDKKTMRLFPPGTGGENYDKAHQTRWAQQNDSFTVLAGTASSRRSALAHREWYLYAGQPNAGTVGTTSQPILRIRRITDHNGNPADQIFRYEYNDLGHPTKTIDPLGRETRIEYAPNGIDVVAVRQKNGAVFETLASFSGYGHDAPHRPRYSTDAAGNATELRWNSKGQLTETINPLGHRSVQTYNVAGYLTMVEQTNPAAPSSLVQIATFTYDSKGRVASATRSDGYVLQFEYDDLNRTTQTTYPDGTSEQYGYSVLSLTTVTDRLGRTSTFTYNGNAQRLSTTDPAGRVTQFDWCSCGSMKSLIDAMGRRTQWRYDIIGRLTAKEYADGSTLRYTYEPASGRIATLIDEKRQVKRSTYNLDDTVAGLAYLNEQHFTPDVSFTYDSIFQRMTSLTDGTGTTAYTYHPVAPGTLGAGQIATVDGPLPDDTLAYTYDPLGRQLGYTLNGVGEAVTYDALGRVTQAVNPLGIFAYSYVGPTARLDTVTYPGGMTCGYAYHPLDDDFRLKDIIHTLPGGVQLSRHSYDYNSFGNIIRWTQTNATAGINRSWQLGYDAADQLTSVAAQDPVTLASLPTGHFNYTYDPAGNRLTETMDGVTTTASYNALNQLVSQTGPAATGLPELAYEWDANDRLLAINYTGTTLRTEFEYDGQGRRRAVVEKDNGAVTDHRSFSWDGLQVAEERDGAGTGVKRRYFGAGMQVDSGGDLQPRLFARDHLGSVRSLISNGSTVATSLDFDPWGRRSVTSGSDDTSLTFTGHWLHESSGLVMAPYRSYSPWQGKWLNRDPVAEAGGFNLNRYVGNNPVTRTDPWGLFEITVTDGGGRNGPTYGGLVTVTGSHGRSVTVPASTWPNPTNPNPGIAEGTFPGTYSPTGHQGRTNGVRVNNGGNVPTNGPNPAQRGQNHSNGINIHCGYRSDRRGSEGCITIDPDYCQQVWDVLQPGETGTINVNRPLVDYLGGMILVLKLLYTAH